MIRDPGQALLSIFVAALACAAVACSGNPRPVEKPRDVLLITVDTARADRFSYTGKPGPGTPRIDALARQGAGFSNAITPVPLTLPAHASLFTGRQPPSHTVRDNGGFRLPAHETTLAELLSEAGFTTAAFIGAEVLDRKYGLDQGFATYDDEITEEKGPSPFLYYPERTAEQVVGAASRWLDAQGDGPLFAWVHLFDPHTPYRPPEPERSRHASAYDGEIAYTDRMVGRLLDHWDVRRDLGRTLVVVTSDHGEGLGEHGEATHGVLVHDSTLLVPLVIRAPGLVVDKTISAPVHLVDVVPTVLGLLDLATPGNVQGRDLGPLLRGKDVQWQRESGYAESLYAQIHHGCAPLVALREERWKVIRGAADELYDLSRDPGELDDLAVPEAQRKETLVADLADLAVRLEGGPAERVILDEQTRQSLAALGYAALPSGARGGPPRDPREALVTMKRMSDADRRLLRGDTAGAIAEYRAVVRSEPASVDGRVRLSQILITQGESSQAVELLVEAVALAPHESVLHEKLGYTLEKLGRHRQALAAYDTGLARHPGARGLRDGRWRCLNQLRRLDVMLAEAERAIALDPTDGMARFARAVACCDQDGLAGYLAALQRELAELPGDPILEAALAQARAGAD